MKITVEQIYDIVGILESNMEVTGGSYEQCRKINEELNKIGFEAEYGLDGEIYSVTKINDND